MGFVGRQGTHEIHGSFTFGGIGKDMLLVPRPDPFLQQMFARMSPGAKFSFTPAQIDEIKKAFSARSFTSHDLDLRYSFSLFGKSYYLVLLAGRERREGSPSRNAAKIFKALAALLAATACLRLSAGFF
jgi:hypothetical protein